MVKGVIGKGGGGKMLVLGITHKNIEELNKGNPIYIMKQDLPGLQCDVLLVSGATEKAIADDLVSNMPDGAATWLSRPHTWTGCF